MKLFKIIWYILLARVTVQAAFNTSTSLKALDSFRTPKNVAFSAFVGGSSHILWVLSILEELGVNFGHKTYFFTRDECLRYVNDYPSIETVTFGSASGYIKDIVDLMKNVRETPDHKVHSVKFNTMDTEFESDYVNLLQLYKSKKIDLAICDHFNTACVEAAIDANIPSIITSSSVVNTDASAPYINNDLLRMRNPTTLDMSLWQRFNDIAIKPTLLSFEMRNYYKKRRAMFKSLGITRPVRAPESLWKDSLKMFNVAFGFEAARPLDPLVEFVGPIVVTPAAAPPLTSELHEFLETHNKVAYVAFGQIAIATSHDIRLLMTGLLEAYEEQAIDGVIWATRGLEKLFPEYLTTRSNTTYNVQSFFQENNKKDVVFIPWAPQIAILNHASASVFITHGGAGSLYESSYAGVPTVVFPFFADQPATAKNVQKNGIGLYLDYKATQQKATEIIIRVARDDGNYFHNNIKRFKAIVQIHSKLGKPKAINLIEEALFTHQNGQLLHRRDVKRDMSFIKAYNLDIYAIMVTIAFTFLLSLANIVRKAIKDYHKLDQKVKAKLA